MGERNPDRQLREARARYLGAARRLHQAANSPGFAGITLDPDADWSETHWAAVLEFGEAHRELVDARRELDALQRDRQPQR